MRPTDPTKRHVEWTTPGQAAEYLDVSVDIIYDGCAAGGLKHVAWVTARFVSVASGSTTGPRRTRVSRSEVRPCRSERVVGIRNL